MAEKSVMSIPVTNGAEAFLEQVRGLKTVRYMFANTGTDHGPIIEALAKTAKEDPTDIHPSSCRMRWLRSPWRMAITTSRTSSKWFWSTPCRERAMHWVEF